MYDPEQLSRLAHRLASLIGEADIVALGLIARYLRRGLDDPEWARKRLGDRTRLTRRILALVSPLEREAGREAEQVVSEALAMGESQAMAELVAAGEPGRPFAVRPATEAAAALQAELRGAVASSFAQILRDSDDVYRSVIAEAASRSLTGEFTRREAAQAALDRLADRGVSSFVDRAGRRWQLASYAEMSTRSTLHNAMLDAHLSRLAERGHDLVRVSDAPGECEHCRPWEGKVLSLTGATPNYPTVDEARAGGLWHRNCRHTAGLYIPGLSNDAPRQTADPEGDAARQKQRYLERGIRQWKRREAAALDDVAVAKAKAKQREWQQRLREHIAETDGKRLRYREQIKRAI